MEEQKTQTFAEWLLNYVKTHPNACVTMAQGVYGDFTMSLCDILNGTPIQSRCSFPGIEYESSELSIDDIFAAGAKRLEKEIENYGK